MYFYSNPELENPTHYPHTPPDVETFYVSDSEGAMMDIVTGECLEKGWYFWFCLPGCLPDSEPYGSFVSEEQAIHACREMVND